MVVYSIESSGTIHRSSQEVRIRKDSGVHYLKLISCHSPRVPERIRKHLRLLHATFLFLLLPLLVLFLLSLILISVTLRSGIVIEFW
jgi:hypothetical protein